MSFTKSTITAITALLTLTSATPIHLRRTAALDPTHPFLLTYYPQTAGQDVTGAITQGEVSLLDVSSVGGSSSAFDVADTSMPRSSLMGFTLDKGDLVVTYRQDDGFRTWTSGRTPKFTNVELTEGAQARGAFSLDASNAVMNGGDMVGWRMCGDVEGERMLVYQGGTEEAGPCVPVWLVAESR
ncbi:MAG: hypothetical protein M1828_006155 [Chrysothrix sp. TS-e1954]|nr:MAG: hypothetical protein M1828_006155 [Chrysothrix sp. TS-e1954]